MTLTHPIGGLALGTGRFRIDALDVELEVLDAWRTGGGRLIDTASVYGHGESELTIGTWLRTRGTRDEVVLLTKGAHPDERDWVINQPFEPVAVIGARSVVHLREALGAAAVSLTEPERVWLEHGDMTDDADRRRKAAAWA